MLKFLFSTLKDLMVLNHHLTVQTRIIFDLFIFNLIFLRHRQLGYCAGVTTKVVNWINEHLKNSSTYFYLHVTTRDRPRASLKHIPQTGWPDLSNKKSPKIAQKLPNLAPKQFFLWKKFLFDSFQTFLSITWALRVLPGPESDIILANIASNYVAN